ncbi:MAG TPA: LysE/ArgO family amino acid transporter [Agromyces sp.]
MSSLFAGLGLGLSLIVAIGAQNLFVLRQGIRREHVFTVAAICSLSDLALIFVGVSGIGAVLQAVPWLVDVIRWAGAAFLVVYGLLAARRALRPSGEALVAGQAQSSSAGRGGAERRLETAHSLPANTGSRDAPSSLLDQRGNATTSVLVRRGVTATVLTALALTWLNPHVYLDTVFLLGSVANTHGDARWVFAAGAGAASILWFFGLAYGARLLGGVLGSPRAWRVLDGVIAVVMIVLGISLVLPH